MTIVTTEVRTVTPELALAWLERNTHNRPMRQLTVNRYATQMKRGLWRLDGMPITFDSNGVMINGQHRLWACIEADTPFDVVVVRGVHPDSFKTMDLGVKRSASDMLSLMGARNTTATAGAIRVVLAYRQQILWSSAASIAITQDDIATEFSRAPEAWSVAATWGKSLSQQGMLSPAGLTALYFTLHEHEPRRAEEFTDAVFTGANLAVDDPRLAFRNTMLAPRRQRTAAAVVFATGLRTWNTWVSGKTLKKIELATAANGHIKLKH